MGKVLLIGGSPMLGKSTAAKFISAKYKLQCLSTDDIGEIMRVNSNIQPMRGMNYLKYYENIDVEEQIEDIKKYHELIGKGIKRLVDVHTNWGSSMVIEGYAIYPDIELNENMDAVWLVADEQLLKERVDRSDAFITALEVAKNKYLERSIWHNNLIKEECKKHNRKVIKVGSQDGYEIIVKKILSDLEIEF